MNVNTFTDADKQLSHLFSKEIVLARLPHSVVMPSTPANEQRYNYSDQYFIQMEEAYKVTLYSEAYFFFAFDVYDAVHSDDPSVPDKRGEDRYAWHVYAKVKVCPLQDPDASMHPTWEAFDTKLEWESAILRHERAAGDVSANLAREFAREYSNQTGRAG